MIDHLLFKRTKGDIIDNLPKIESNRKQRRIVGAPMPHFYMNIGDNGYIIPDPEGDEFSTAVEAVENARATVRDILARPETYGERVAWERRRIEIVDETGARISEVPFSDDAEAGAETPPKPRR